MGAGHQPAPRAAAGRAARAAAPRRAARGARGDRRRADRAPGARRRGGVQLSADAADAEARRWPKWTHWPGSGASVTVFRLGDDPRLAAFVDLVARRSGGRVVRPTSTASAPPWSATTYGRAGAVADGPAVLGRGGAQWGAVDGPRCRDRWRSVACHQSSRVDGGRRCCVRCGRAPRRVGLVDVRVGAVASARGVLGGAVAGLVIAALDLGVIGRRYPEIRALPRVPQVLDHVAFGVLVVPRSRRGSTGAGGWSGCSARTRG